MAKAIIYLRVSTRGQTTENQLPVLKKWVADRGYELIEVYSENESAWRSGHQRKLVRLFANLHKRKVDTCLAWALDRLIRGSIPRLLAIKRLDRAEWAKTGYLLRYANAAMDKKYGK